MSITASFDLDALARAIEERDAAGQSARYAADAELRVIDSEHPPSSPLVLRGRDQIAAHVQDVCSRDMTHQVERALQNGDVAAIQVACRYPDGSRVLCLATLDLHEGEVVRQTTIQAWDA